VLLLVSAAGTLIVQLQVDATRVKIADSLHPAQVGVAMLTEAYTDQETGQRGYLLTGDLSFLQPYTSGLDNAAQLQQHLGKDLAGDPRARRMLAEIKQAAASWQTQVSTPEIAQRAHGPLSAHALLRGGKAGERLTATLHAALSALRARIDQLVGTEVERVNSAQVMDNWLTGAAGAAGLGLVIVSVLVLRRSLARPLTRLVGEVQRVAAGDLGHSVDATGPDEFVAVGRAVESMRVRILEQTNRAMQMQRVLDLTEESERIAHGLQDRVIRRLSATGLALQSAAGRHPGAARALAAAVDEIDGAIRELRTVVFGLTADRANLELRERVLDLVAASEPRLTFSPRLQLSADVGAGSSSAVADELIGALGRILSDLATCDDATEADIILGMSGGDIRLRVADDGWRSPAQLAAGSDLDLMRERAERIGGRCAISSEPGGTTIEWQVPAARARGKVPPARSGRPEMDSPGRLLRAATRSPARGRQRRPSRTVNGAQSRLSWTGAAVDLPWAAGLAAGAPRRAASGWIRRARAGSAPPIPCRRARPRTCSLIRC
jgi:signal transduction histidine kinase